MTARLVGPALLVAMALAAVACSGRALGRQYEYEEEIYLRLDGSATVVVNASLPALVALRGLAIDPAPAGRFDRAELRRAYEGPGVHVTRVSRPWRRAGRRFVQVRVEADDLRTLGRLAPFAWSTYRFDAEGGLFVYRQRLGGAPGTAAPAATWAGRELVAVRVHVPSRIEYHNAPSLEVERGNILAWEQPIADRLAGRPVEIEVRMQQESILRRTLLVFGLSVSAALLLLAAVVWWVRKKGHEAARPAA